MTQEQKTLVVAEVEAFTQSIIAALEDKSDYGVLPLDTLIELESRKAIIVCDGDIARAAALLGIGKTTLYRNILRWNERHKHVISRRKIKSAIAAGLQ